ncbi:hypothetical protein MHB50_18460 [Siminovitchia sp. FSL H7-0308]
MDTNIKKLLRKYLLLMAEIEEEFSVMNKKTEANVFAHLLLLR